MDKLFNNIKISPQIEAYADNTMNNEYHNLGLKDPAQFEIYELVSHPGLIIIRNPFTCIGQRYWIARCLSDYTKKPNILNLDAHNTLRVNTDWWVSSNCEENKGPDLKEKLRWATLGYHHNWDTKEYSDLLRTPFPADLSVLCSVIARVALNSMEYIPQAAIINFYRMDSNLSGHTDHSEPNLNAPLISISFGQTAIFLVGGRTIQENPVSMFLHSGDIIIMAGESRLRYHGVPRIIKSSSEPWNNDDNNFCSSDKDNYNNKNDSLSCLQESSIFLKKRESVLNSSDVSDSSFFYSIQGDSSESKIIRLNGAISNNRMEEVNITAEWEPQNCSFEKNMELVYKDEASENHDNCVTIYQCSNETFWKPFRNYIRSSRININVRQVLFTGQETLTDLCHLE